MIDPGQREKCLKEVKLLQSVNHPHIIQYLDSFIANNELFIAVEWAEKGDLKRIIKRAIQVSDTPHTVVQDETKLDEARIWEYITQIASGIEHMHSKRIMHRDLKPANIFITADGTLKLGDLGLGRYFSSQTIEAFSRVGTPLYMSPEVLSGNGYDWKSDVWSMGCIAYELAALRSPFRADDAKVSLYDLFKTISKGEYPAIESRYSEELRNLIDMMLRLNPSERYDAEQVMKVCKEQKDIAIKRPKIDPSLVMDDIIEKLRLLNYEVEFCKRFNRPPLSRIYFSHEEDSLHAKFSYFYELSYWLMSFSKKRAKLIGGINEFNPDLTEEAKLKQLLMDLATFGVKLPDNMNTKQISTVLKTMIRQGYGEIVCYLINDLVNRELIQKDFKFLPPVFLEDNEEKKEIKDNDCEEEDNNIEVVEDQNFELNLAKYLREDHSDFEISPTKIQQAEAEKEYPESPVDPKLWDDEFKRAKEKLKDAGKVSEKDKYLYNIHKLTRYFEKIKDIMAIAGNSTLNSFIFLSNKCLNAIAAHEKRLNSNIAPDLVKHQFSNTIRLQQ